MSKRVRDLFLVRYGHSLSLNKMTKTAAGEGIAFVSRTAKNNGIAAWVEPISDLAPEPSGLLTVCLRSRNHALATFVQPRDFYTAFHVFVLEPLSPMTVQEKLWWASCIEANRFRYHFGRQANRSLADLELPDEVPAWIENAVIPSLRPMGRTRSFDLLGSAEEWKLFNLVELFDLARGRTVLKRDMRPGTTAYVGASAGNNGVTAWIDLEPDWPAGCLTVASNGSIGEAFYQLFPFIASGDVNVLVPRQPMSAAAGLFVCTLIRSEQYRYNYARKWVLSRMRESAIRLPVDEAGKPDWPAIEQAMRSIPLADMVLG